MRRRHLGAAITGAACALIIGCDDGGDPGPGVTVDAALTQDQGADQAVGDMAALPDAAADRGVPGDMTAPDAAGDMGAPIDMMPAADRGAADMAGSLDMATGPDMAGSPDMAGAPDMATGPDMAIGPDMAVCTPVAEICNALDDDCDGLVDEDLPAVPTQCGVGACAAVGEAACVDGAIVDGCTPGAPMDELCDALDNDCDGAADEGVVEGEWFVDPDGDGFHGPSLVDAQPSCAAWLAAGRAEDGVYLIDPDGPDGRAPFQVFCDMTTDGGGWTRVFHHDIAGGYWTLDEAPEHAAADPLALRYSILARLEAFRSSDGAFDFRIDWPDSGLPGRNIWRQASNPTTDAVAGYVPVDIDFDTNGWGGLERNRFTQTAFIDGGVGIDTWFYAIATVAEWGSPPGIPAWQPAAAEVALWVRPDDPPVTAPAASIVACGPLAGHAADGGDCAPDVAAAHPGAEEICDGLDNDCDGQTDEGFDAQVWYPDADADGQGASAGTSCASLFAAGVVEDGVYRIWPAGPNAPALDVYCDMTTDGGGWTRVFFHDVADGYFRSDADAAARRVGDPLALRYSILDRLEAFRSADGAFDLRINWPESAVAGRNIWRQTSNPTAGPVEGYVGVSIDHATQLWGGLEPANRDQTWLNGSVGHQNWFYSVGSQVPWGDPAGVPAAQSPAERVAVWVRPDDDRAGGAAQYACVQPAGFVAEGGDCDDTDPAVASGIDERCNGRDDNCDGVVDEGCEPGGVALRVLPRRMQVYPRDPETDRCTVLIEGDTEGAARSARVIVTRDGEAYAQAEGDGPAFAIPVAIEAGLHRYAVTIEWTDAEGLGWRFAEAVDDVVCGDVILIDGQSNAVAYDYHRERLGDRERDPFVRSFGSADRNAGALEDTSFSIAVADAGYVRGAIGQWGLRLANRIREAEQVPVLVINGAVGGTRVDQHQRNDANPTDPNTIYGRLLWRAQQAGVADAARAIFWHQGESDGGLAYATYLERWTAMYDDWLTDYPGVEGVFVFQVRAGCGNPTWNRNVHRDLPALLPRVLGSMSTTGVDGHDNCHFEHRTYAEWGERMARIALRDIYGAAPEGNIDAPSPQSARWRTPTELVIEFGATGEGMVLQAGAEAWFSLAGGVAIQGVAVEGTQVVITTAAPSEAAWVSLVDVPGDIPWLVNDLGIGAFAFYELAIDR